ncbi:MAG: cation:proton antiporter [Bacteroidia bacterium]|nr:cation:proton antiporter [Bacteroidia bacterium]NNF31468.1 sodium:proton antiporter [Flavobacteriaceae bacterium]MBT8275543.1 cation:proton antiporter [Bacteroidia bacterium]NNJ82057.1 sodium:proton antiporter [Flavobacteriaceae bacterium]NNK54047.1 sodium:proton antiporter [Flavobacteriaceae bacterium]
MLELAGIIVLGILAQWVAWKLKIPAILPLILIGLFVGPISTLVSEDGSQWIQPIFDGKSGFFPGQNLFYFVSLAIGIILFEGGLTLRSEEVKKIGPVIGKLISLGSAVTFIGGGVAAHYIFGLDWRIAFLFSALIIVTGPTVITPILRNIPLKKEVSAVLKWEGILIDPIGALVAVLVFEFISVGGDAGYTKQALVEFGKIVLIGFSFGISGGYALYYAIKKRFIPHYLLNVVSLSVVLLIFVESDVFAHESGLLAVVVMGMFLGNSDLPSLKELLYFKESLSVLLISILFILLAANITLDDLLLVYNWETGILLAVIIFVLRPMAVFLSTTGSSLKTNEKLFISWVGPRGIVAAGIASLFGTKLVEQGIPGAEYITPLVFAVVLVTVLLNAATARLFASIVGVFLKTSEGIVIIGASKVSRLIGVYLQKNNRHVVLVDTNSSNIDRAKDLGLEAMNASIHTDDLTDNIELNDVGYLIAMTGNPEINKQAISKYGKTLGENGSYRLMSADELKSGEIRPGTRNDILTTTHDYLKLVQVVSEYPSIQDLPINSKDQFLEILNRIEKKDEVVALFLKDEKNNLELITDPENMHVDKGCQIVYLGKPIDLEGVVQMNNSNESQEDQ